MPYEKSWEFLLQGFNLNDIMWNVGYIYVRFGLEYFRLEWVNSRQFDALILIVKVMLTLLDQVGFKK